MILALLAGLALWWLIWVNWLAYVGLLVGVAAASLAWRLADEWRRARAVPRAQVVWFSPDCVYFSKTKGRSR